VTFAGKWEELQAGLAPDDPREKELVEMIKFFFYAGAYALAVVMQNSVGNVEQAGAALKEITDFMDEAEAEVALDGFRRVARGTTIQ